MSLVPMVIEQTSKGERSFDIYSRLLRDRIIVLHDGINDNSASLITSQMLYLESEDPDADIYLYINSPGGSVTAACHIYDVMNFIQPRVFTVSTGIVASAGSFLAQAGSKGCRLILPNTRVMVHQPSSGNQRSTVSDLEIAINESKFWKKHLTELYVKHNSAGKTYEDFEKIMDRDTYLSAQEAVEWGMADRIIESRADLKNR